MGQWHSRSCYYYICVLIRVYMCPHTTHTSILLYMCPHTTMCVSSYTTTLLYVSSQCHICGVQRAWVIFFLFSFFPLRSCVVCRGLGPWHSRTCCQGVSCVRERNQSLNYSDHAWTGSRVRSLVVASGSARSERGGSLRTSLRPHMSSGSRVRSFVVASC